MKFDVDRFEREANKYNTHPYGWYANFDEKLLEIMDSSGWGRDTFDCLEEEGFKHHFCKELKKNGLKQPRYHFLELGVDMGIQVKLLDDKKYSKEDVQDVVASVLQFVSHYGKHGYIKFE